MARPGGFAKRSVLTAALLALGAAEARAQPYVRAECRAEAAAKAPEITDALTANWRRRFWTGDCGSLRGCLSGSPNWNEIVGRLAERAPAGDRAAVFERGCRLGVLIEREWTRPRAVRRIDTGDLKHFKARMDSAQDVLSGIEEVEREAQAKIAGTS